MKRINGHEFCKLVKDKTRHEILKARFDLSDQQLEQVFDRLLASRHLTYEEIHGIPQLEGLRKSRIRDICYSYIGERDFDGAKKIVEYIRTHFPDLKGFKSLISRVDAAVEYDRRERDYLNFMASYRSLALEKFKATHPYRFQSLHKELIRQVKHLETSEFVKEWSSSPLMEDLAEIGNAYERLERLIPYSDLMDKLSDLQAASLWQLIGLKIFGEKKVQAFTVRQYDMHLRCSEEAPCMWISYMTFPISVGEGFVDKSLAKIANTKLSTATIEMVDNMPPEQAKRNLVKQLCFLPPFCEGCTCQIFAYPLDW